MGLLHTQKGCRSPETSYWAHQKRFPAPLTGLSQGLEPVTQPVLWLGLLGVLEPLSSLPHTPIKESMDPAFVGFLYVLGASTVD